MYVIVALAVTVLVIALAWRGVGVTKRTEDGSYGSRPERPAVRPTFGQPPRPRPRIIAPDDDPEFLSEIDRRLREEGKSN